MISPSRHQPQPASFELIGVSHHTLPVELREEVNAKVAEREVFFSRCLSQGGATGAAVVSTCNRVEIIGVVEQAGQDAHGTSRFYHTVREFFSSLPEKSIYHYRGVDAVRHLFRVAASLDSLVVGEAQILGQVKEAYEEARAQGAADKYLHSLFQCSFRVAKKVRESTSVGERGVSVSYVGVQLAKQIVGDLAKSRVLVLGGGRMAELVAIHLASHGCSYITVANRTVSRAAALASRVGGVAASLDGVDEYAREADIVIGALSVPQPIIVAQQVRRWKRRTPLFLIDLGVPRNFDPSLAELDDAYLYNIDDLGKIADKNRELREKAAKDAEVFVEYGVHQFQKWVERLRSEPLILELRSLIRDVCEEEVAGVAAALSADQRELFTHRVSQKLAHHLLTLARREWGVVEEDNGDAVDTILPAIFDELLQVKSV